MAETDILNDKNTWDDDIQDNPCPDYGFTRKRPNTRVTGKAPGGQPFSREAANNGYTFQLSWLNRSYACVQRVKRFAEQYEDGYFTIIDRDGGGSYDENGVFSGGRHYVGRFVGECSLVVAGNDNWDIRDLTFEEVPGAPMLEYPADWDRDSIALAPWNDYGRQLAAFPDTWTAGTAAGVQTLNNDGSDPTSFAAIEYRGYGFQLFMLAGPAFGQVEVSLDGAVLATVDCYSDTDSGSKLVFANGEVSTDLHRVKLRPTGNKNASSSSAAISWVKLQVMR